MLTTHKLSNERFDAQKFINKALLFLSPVIFIFLLNALIDPFNLNHFISLPLEKQEVACHFNERLWKLSNFLNHPQENIILGDSRASRLSKKTLQSLTGKPFTNLSLSGATLIEIIDTFWFVADHAAIKDILFCINFDRFNDWQKASGVAQTVSTLKNPLMNYLQPETCKAVLTLLMQKIVSKKLNQEPPLSREAFWQFQLDEIDICFKRYNFPVYGARQLSKIADYCKKHGISLSFLILPTHSDLQARIDNAQLCAQETEFKLFLSSLAHVFDFDGINDFTTNKLNFDDPKHVNFEAMDKLISSYFESTFS